MEENRSLTFADQAVIDTELTSIKSKEKDLTPFEFALKSSIKNWVAEDVSEYEISSSRFRNIQEEFEKALTVKDYQTDMVTRDIKYLRNYSTTLQSWKGVVVEIKEDCFVAELDDLTNGGTKEIAEIELFSVSPDDRKLVSVGASFYWNIGYKMNNGQITKESLIRFQRIIDWNEDDYNQAADRASELFENINFD